MAISYNPIPQPAYTVSLTVTNSNINLRQGRQVKKSLFCLLQSLQSLGAGGGAMHMAHGMGEKSLEMLDGAWPDREW